MNKEEAIKILKDFHDKSALFSVRTALDTIFPELCESEDEKIRKEIISFIQDHIDEINLQVSGDYDTRDKEDIALQEWCKKAIAWLEKQKEPKLSEDLGEYITELSKQFPEVSFAKLSRIAVRVKNWLEKQGEMSKMCPTSVQDEQQPIDKVEPKFKVGDWIIHQGTENIYQVVSRIDNQYQLKYGDNYTIQKCADVDKDARLWTIDDAKDGDVLADDDNNIFIFDGTVEEGKYPFAYCGLTAQGFDSYDIRLPFTHDNNIHPATWEQRNLLFKKMKESGYEWDDEKKELKKIEKKSQRMVSAEAKEALYDKPTDEEMKELLRTEYEKGRADTIAEMKSAWSEEDELNLKQAIYVCHQNEYTAVENWLKSLKERVQPIHEYSDTEKQEIFLRSQRPHFWRPSEEQVKALKYVAYHLMPDSNYRQEMFSLYEDLKKLTE